MFKLLKSLKFRLSESLFTIRWKSANFFRQKRQHFRNKFGKSLADYYESRGHDRSGLKKPPETVMNVRIIK